MSIDKKHHIKKWGVSFIELENLDKKQYKVTRRIPELSVSETKIFEKTEDAKRQFDSWLK